MEPASPPNTKFGVVGGSGTWPVTESLSTATWQGDSVPTKDLAQSWLGGRTGYLGMEKARAANN